MAPRARAIIALSVLATACRAASPASPVGPTPASGPEEQRVDGAAASPDGARAEIKMTQPPRSLVAYRLSPKLQGDELVALTVDLRFDMPMRGGPTRLRLPQSWAGAAQLWRNVHDVSILGATAVEPVDPVTPTEWIIRAAPKTRIYVSYEVRSAYPEPPKASVGQPFEPIITPTWFYAFGQALFATVDVPDPEVTFSFAKAPPGFAFASDLEHLPPEGAQIGELLDSVVIGGSAVRVHAAKGAGNERLRVALAGEFTFSPTDFTELATAILLASRSLFGARGEPFLIAVSPLVPESGSSIGGTSMGDAFALSISQDTPLPALALTISHEYFHTWNPRLLGGPEEQQAVERQNKWFSEGFTDFYAPRLLQRTGRATPEDFLASWNELLLAYASSPVRAAPGKRIEDDYWNDPDVGKLPYQRGRLLAALWDHKLRQATGDASDLDDVLVTMHRSFELAPDADRKQLPPAADRFLAAYQGKGGPALDEDVARYLVRGEPIELPADVFGACVRVKKEERAAFERGWDPVATSRNKNVVTGLRKGSFAYNAGLRDGMTILRRLSGAPGDVTVPYSLRVLAGTRERTITFWPRGEGKVSVQRLELTAARTPESRAACSALLGGDR